MPKSQWTRREVLRGAARAVAAPGIIALGGCGTGPPDDGRTHLRYMAWGNPEQLQTEEELIRRFEEQNDDIRVKLFKVPGTAYRNKMILMFASRTAPDVVRVDHYDFPQLVRRGYFHDLEDFASADDQYDKADFVPWTVEEGSYEGRLHGLNVLCGGNLIYYNKTMLEKAGQEEPYELWKQGRWTWSKLREQCLAVSQHRADGRPIQLGFQFPAFVNQAPLLYSYGVDILSEDRKTCHLDSEQAIAAYQYLLDLRFKDRVSPTPGEAAQSFFKFESGRIAFQVDWMGLAPIFRKTIKSFEWDICPTPAGPATDLTVCKGNQLVMNAETRHPEASWRFMRYMTGPEAEMYLCGKLRRASATRVAVLNDPEFLATELPPYHTDAYVFGMQHARQLPIDERWQEWNVVVNQYLETLYVGGPRDVSPTLRQMKRHIDRVLQDEGGF